MRVAILLMPPLMQPLHVPAVEVHEGLFLGRGHGVPARNNQSVQANGALGPACIQLIQHLLQMPFGLQGRHNNCVSTIILPKFYQTSRVILQLL